MATRTTSKYDPFDYLNTQELKYATNISESELRKVYSNLRSIARKRVERLENYEYGKSAQLQRIQATGLPTLKEIKNRSELAMYLRNTAAFLTSQHSTVSGIKEIRANTVKEFREQGFERINNKNLDAFIEFFEDAKSRAGRGYATRVLAEMWNMTQRKKITPEKIMQDFDTWYEKAYMRVGDE